MPWIAGIRRSKSVQRIHNYGKEILALIGSVFLLGVVSGYSSPPDVVAGAAELDADSQSRPNIVWIVSDDFRLPFGDHVRALVDAGAAVAEMSSVAESSLTTRSVLLTGMHATVLGLDDDGWSRVPESGVKVVPEWLRRAGYYTSRGGSALHNLAANQSTAVPRDLSQPGLIGAWDAAGRGVDWKGKSKDWEFPCTVSFGCAGVATERDRPFFAMFNLATAGSELDSEIGSVLAELRADGHFEHTVVFLVGTSGDRTPLVVWAPEANRAELRYGDDVSVIDLAPTVLSLAGLSIPFRMKGNVLFDQTERQSEVKLATKDQSISMSSISDEIPTAAQPNGYPTGGLFHVAPRTELQCDTEGSTIVYTTEREPPFYWRIYTGPFRMRFWTLRFQCGRLGYHNSEIVRYEFDIE